MADSGLAVEALLVENHTNLSPSAGHTTYTLHYYPQNSSMSKYWAGELPAL